MFCQKEDRPRSRVCRACAAKRRRVQRGRFEKNRSRSNRKGRGRRFQTPLCRRASPLADRRSRQMKNGRSRVAVYGCGRGSLRHLNARRAPLRPAWGTGTNLRPQIRTRKPAPERKPLCAKPCFHYRPYGVYVKQVARPRGFEPLTLGSGGQCSIRTELRARGFYFLISAITACMSSHSGRLKAGFLRSAAGWYVTISLQFPYV